MLNPSKLDEHEQTGAGLRELLQRFKAARTREELRLIATEAERPATQPSQESTIERAYGVLADLARTRVAALTPGEIADAEAGA